MRRRQFLAGAATSCVGALAGCAGLVGPDLDLVELVQPDPYAVSVDTEGTEYFGTIHNRGSDGNVRLELWFFRDASVPNPSVSSLFATQSRPDRTFDLARSAYFSEGERREISMTASHPPDDWADREFGIVPMPASHGAIFRNTGASGEVEVTLEYRDTNGYDLTEPPARIEGVGSDTEFEVMFDVVIPGGVEYEIVAEPR